MQIGIPPPSFMRAYQLIGDGFLKRTLVAFDGVQVFVQAVLS